MIGPRPEGVHFPPDGAKSDDPGFAGAFVVSIPRRLRLGRGVGCLPDRGRQQARRQRGVDLGPLRHPGWRDQGRVEPRRRLRSLPPLRGRRRLDPRPRPGPLPALGRLAPGHPRRLRRGQPGGARLLRPTGRRPARPRSPALGYALPLGLAPALGRPGRLDLPGDGGRLCPVCRGRREAAGRPRRPLVHDERDPLLHRLRLRVGDLRARASRAGEGGEPGVSPRDPGSRPGGGRGPRVRPGRLAGRARPQPPAAAADPRGRDRGQPRGGEGRICQDERPAPRADLPRPLPG